VVVVVIWEFLSWNGVNLGTPKRGAGGAAKIRVRAAAEKRTLPGKADPALWETLYIHTRIWPGRMEPKTLLREDAGPVAAGSITCGDYIPQHRSNAK
jgi:hypothetical protein